MLHWSAHIWMKGCIQFWEPHFKRDVNKLIVSSQVARVVESVIIHGIGEYFL